MMEEPRVDQLVVLLTEGGTLQHTQTQLISTWLKMLNEP